MSTFKEIEENAKKKGILLDSCNLDERHYTFGLYTDFCGMSYEDALRAQLSGDTAGNFQKTNVVTLKMEESAATDEYELVLTLSAPSAQEVIIAFTYEGEDKKVIVPPGSTRVETGILNNSKFATVGGISITSTDDSFKFKPNNQVKDGIFKAMFVVENVVVEEKSIKAGDPITFPTVEEREGHTFDWQDIEPDAVMPEQDITIIGAYTPNTYTITWIINGVTEQTDNVTYGNAITEYEGDGREGHTLVWNDEIPQFMPAQNLVINGNYVANSYTITYYVQYDDGELTPSGDTQNVVYGTNVALHDGPTVVGYTFQGWTLVDGSDVPDTMPARNLEVVGKLTVNYHNITWILYREQADGAFVDEIYKEETLRYDQDIKVTIPEESGYTFQKWYQQIVTDGDKLTGTTIPPSMPDRDIVITGKTILRSYDIIYYAQTDEGAPVYVEEKAVKYTAPIALPSGFTEKEGHDFLGLTIVQSDGTEIQEFPTTMPYYNLNVTARFESHKFTLTVKFVDENDDVIATKYSENIPYGSAVDSYYASILEQFHKENTIIGHTTQIVSGDTAYIMTDDYEMTVKYTANSYNVTYYTVKDGTQTQYGEIISVKYGAQIPTDKLDETGYTFQGWRLQVVSEDGTVTETSVPPYMPDHDIVLIGRFNINEYAITYKIVGEEGEYRLVMVKYNAPIPEFIPEPDEREGYEFSGWAFENEEDVSLTTMPARDIIVIGSFTAKYYPVYYYFDGAEYNYTMSQYGSQIELIDEPSHDEGYTFSGWKLADGSEVPSTMPAHRLDIYGTLSANSYNLSFVVDGYDTSASTVSYGTELAPLVPVMESPKLIDGVEYVFAWTDAIPETMPAHDLVINGEYTEFKLSDTVYYGSVYATDIDNVTTDAVMAMNSYTESGRPTTLECRMPVSEEYVRLWNAAQEADDNGDSELAEELVVQANAVRDTTLYYDVVAVPSQLELSKVTMAGMAITEKWMRQAGTLNINGSTYDIYTYQGDAEQFKQGYVEAVHIYTITLISKETI